MELKSEVHILKKNVFIIVQAFLFSLLFTACANYGLYQTLFGEDDVDERFKCFSNLNSEAPVLPKDTDGKYSFLVVSDIHIGANDVHHSKINKFLDKEIPNLFSSDDKTRIPRFLINLGDTGDGGHSKEYSEFNEYFGIGGKIQNIAKEKGIVEKAEDFKIYSILGNHDLYNNGWENWKKMVWPYTTSFYFSVSSDSKYKPLSFYFVDTGNGSLGKDQTDAFETLLKSDQNPKLIFSHYPFYSDQVPFMAIEDTTERNYLLDLFQENKAADLFGGHVHTNFKKDLGSFNQINTAALFKNGYYRLVTVDEKTSAVTSELINF